MVKHIVMWKVNEKSSEILNKIKEDLESLKDKITEIEKIEVGINFNESDAAFDVALYSEFKNQEGLNTYQNHPEHVKVAQFVKSVVTSRAVVDYEV